jgi:hypothetical protein
MDAISAFINGTPVIKRAIAIKTSPARFALTILQDDTLPAGQIKAILRNAISPNHLLNLQNVSMLYIPIKF